MIVVDAYSRDDTVAIAKAFGAKILVNGRLTAEAGKTIGARAAEGELILFIDSDNVLTSSDWLTRMIEPLLRDGEIVASEALYYGYDRHQPSIIRYCALMGADDPLSVYLGFYGRYSLLKQRWSDIVLNCEEKGSYIRVTLRDGILPTMGANGFLIRRNVLRLLDNGPYLFDVDIAHGLVNLGHTDVARVRVAVTHLYAFGLSQYIRKTHRRIRDYYFFNRLGARRYGWQVFDKRKLLRLLLTALIISPLLVDSLKGYRRRSDVAWLLNWPIVFITFMVYGITEVSSGFHLLRGREGMIA